MSHPFDRQLFAAPYLRGDWRAVREVQRQLNKRD